MIDRPINNAAPATWRSCKWNRLVECLAGSRLSAGLFHQFKQWTLRVGCGRNLLLGFRLCLIAHHGVTQRLQFCLADLIELHPEIENRNRDQPGSVRVCAFNKVNPALFESEENRMKCCLWISHRLCSLASPADDLVYSVLALS